MKSLLLTAFALGFAVAAPNALWAQPRPNQNHPAPMHRAVPAMHAHPSAARTHVSATHHAVHHVSHHTVHHIVRHHVTAGARHVTHAVVAGRGGVAALRRNVTARHPFRVGAYRAPPGYQYRRWTFGERLPGIYFGRDFWITDFLNYGLFAPPDGYVWVRYGPDALLIDENSGEIIQVDYGEFY